MDFNLHASTTSAKTYFQRVQLAEELGYRGPYIGEGQLDILNPFQLIAAARFVSSDIHLGTATTNIVFRDPTLLAGEAGTANQLIGGRFVLGIATGDSAAYQLGRRITKIAEMEEATKTIRALLSGESLETPSGPVPLRFPVGDTVPPIYFAVEGPKGQRAAGRVADGVMMGTGFDLDLIDTVRSRVAEGAEEVGRDPASIDLMAAGIIYVSDEVRTHVRGRDAGSPTAPTTTSALRWTPCRRGNVRACSGSWTTSTSAGRSKTEFRPSSFPTTWSSGSRSPAPLRSASSKSRNWHRSESATSC